MAASPAADDGYVRAETCTDSCGLNWSKVTASPAADVDYVRVETCTDPCGLNWSKVAASPAADDYFWYYQESEGKETKKHDFGTTFSIFKFFKLSEF